MSVFMFVYLCLCLILMPMWLPDWDDWAASTQQRLALAVALAVVVGAQQPWTWG